MPTGAGAGHDGRMSSITTRPPTSRPRTARGSAVRRHAATTAAILALGLGLAACGGGDGPDTGAFKRQYDAQRTELNAITARIGEVLTGADGKTDEQVTTEIRDVERAFDAGLTKLERLDPPEDVRKDFDEMTRIARALDGDLKRIGDAAAAHDADGARAATEELARRAPSLEAPAKRVAEGVGLPPSTRTTGRAPTTSTP